MAIPKPVPKDWQLANAQVLQVTDREVLAVLRAAKKNVDKLLAELPQGKSEIRRAQLEHSRAKLLAEQATLFERLGDVVSARRAAAAARSAQLSAASDAALLRAVGKGAQAQFLYDSALQVSQRAIDTALARLKLSALPLSKRIYNTSVWMGGRLSRMISETMASGLDAKEFAKRARDWFNPNTPGGVRFAAMRLARTEINNAFHAMSAQRYAETPWVTKVDWNLSKSHPKRDICNEVADDSPFDKDKVPARPHPQCMCYITARAVEEDEFIDRFIAGEYDDFLDAELEAKGWHEKEDPPAPKPVVKAAPVAPPAERVNALPLTGREALDSVPKGLYKRGSMTPHQRAGLKVYESGWFAVINGALRSDNRWDDPVYAEEIRDIGRIDSAMVESVLPNDIQVSRGIYNAELLFGKGRLGHDLTGLAWQEKAYTSTTANERITDLFNLTEEQNKELSKSNVKMTITVPAGTQALVTSTFEKGSKENGPQAEITLQRGLKFTVTKDNGVDENGVRRIEVRADPVGTAADGAGTDAGEAGRDVQSTDPERASEPDSTSALPQLTFAERTAFAAKKGAALQSAHFGLDRKLGSPNYHKMTDEMRRGVNQYTGEWYRDINRHLRTGAPVDSEIQGFIKGIDAAMKESTTDRDALVYRGMHSASLLFGDRLAGNMTGLEWKEQAYVSTTSSEKKRSFFTGSSGAKDRVILRILVPSGTHAVEASGLNAESELLIDRNTNFRVVADNGYDENGIRQLDIEVFS